MGLFFSGFIETVYAYTVVDSSITSDTVWTKENSPYIIRGVAVISPSVTLTVNPGVIVKFEDGGYGHFGNLTVDGILKADATLEDPIYFTSFRDDTVGGDTNGDGSATTPSVYNSQNWIKLNSAVSASLLNNVYIKYNYYGLLVSNGSHQITKTHLIKNGYGIYMQGGKIEMAGAEIADNGNYGVAVDGGNLTISDSEINSKIKGSGQGVYIGGNGDTVVKLIRNIIQNQSTPLTIQTNGSVALYSNKFIDNSLPIQYNQGTFESDGQNQGSFFRLIGSITDFTLTKEFVYFIKGSVNIPSSVTLTVNPGVIVKFEDGGYGHFGNLTVDGILKADATLEDPIYFTSFRDDTVGGDTNGDGSATTPSVYNSQNWIKLNSAVSASLLNNVYIKYNYYGLLVSNGSHQITKTHLIKNGYGIYMQGGKIEMAGAEIADNGNYGVAVDGGNLTVKNSSIHNNTQGLYVSSVSSLKVDAKNNWWGNASGPYHAVFNITGTGDKIGGDLFNNFTPWLTSEPVQQPENYLPIISEIKQYQIDLIDSLAEIPEGNKIDSGTNESPKVSVTLKVKVSDPDNDRVNLIVSLNKFLEGSTDTLLYGMSPSGFVNSGEIASVKFENLEEGSYYWEIKAIDEKGNESEAILFGEPSRTKPDFKFSNDFSFVHMTDVHLGSNKAVLARQDGKDWYEEWSYPRFTDALYEIEKMTPKPDFILISGDNVEYNDIRWLVDFKSITENFTLRTGIQIYVVPGNHDRFDSPSSGFNWCNNPNPDEFPCNWAGGNDSLKNYFKIIEKPKYKNINILLDDWIPLKNDKGENFSEEGGKNWYNYYFNHNGMQIIGLDSGEDASNWDLTPQSKGISNDVMKSINDLGLSASKIIFMHNPVFTGKLYDVFGIPFIDSTFDKNRGNFIDFAKDHSVELVLSGHNHETRIFHATGNVIAGGFEDAGFESNEGDVTRPLFIQTQSATKDNFIDANTKYEHGYRIIDVKKGVATPRTVEKTAFYDKIIADLDQNNNAISNSVKLLAYKEPSETEYFKNSDDSYFAAGVSERMILYDYKNNVSRFGVFNFSLENNKYDFFASKNNEDFTKVNLRCLKNNLEKSEDAECFSENTENAERKIVLSGFKVKNSEYCLISQPFMRCEGGFIEAYNQINKTGERIDFLKFKDMDIKNNRQDDIFIDWLSLSGANNSELSGVILKTNDNSNTVFEEVKKRITVQLHSPGQLQVIDSSGKVSGLVNGTVKEEILYSVYDEMNEAVILFVDQGVNDNQYSYKVVGTADADYGLTIIKKDGFGAAENIVEFDGSSIPTILGQVHQYSIDWNALANNGKGATLKIDKEGDGVFDQTVNVGATLNDMVAPTSGILISGTEGNSGWHISDVQIELSAEDNEGGVGVEKIEYSLDGGRIWNKYIAPFAITEEGIRNILYRSQDFFGNIEEMKIKEIKIDKTFPEAEIYFNAENKFLKIEGFDNFTLVDVKTEENKNYLLTDEAGNALKIIFDRIKQEGREIKAEFYSLQYGGNPAIILPKTELKYEWSFDKNDLIKELEQKIEIKDLFKIQAKYDGKKNITFINIEEKNEKEKDSEKKREFEGMKVIKIITDKGEINYKF